MSFKTIESTDNDRSGLMIVMLTFFVIVVLLLLLLLFFFLLFFLFCFVCLFFDSFSLFPPLLSLVFHCHD